MKKVLFALGLLVIAGTGTTAEKTEKKKAATDMVFPHSISLGAMENNDNVYIDCDGQEPYYTMNCKFVMITIWNVRERLKADTQKMLTQDNLGTDKDMEQLRSAMKELSGSKLDENVKKLSPEKAAIARMYAELAKTVPTSNNKEEFRKFIASMSKLGEDTCEIHTTTWETAFKKTGQGTWTSHAEPAGLCNLMTLETLERPEFGLWTYTNTRIAVGNDTEFCKSFKKEINKPHAYTWNAPKKFAPSCKQMEYK